MARLHQEKTFEDEVCQDAHSAGWLHEPHRHGLYNRALALVPADLMNWLEATHPAAVEWAKKKWGPDAQDQICTAVRSTLDTLGSHHVFHKGFDLPGAPASAKVRRMFQAKPKSGISQQVEREYRANVPRLLRQVQYSVSGSRDGVLDLVWLLNGIPVATAELKTDLTQAVEDAKEQYRSDRPPINPLKKIPEPLLSFPGGALVHFALSTREVYMTTRLAGDKTYFLPFNKGCDGGSGNPDNPMGYPTDYLWKEVLAPDSLLDIIENYFVVSKKRGKIEEIILPRYHQLDAPRKLTDDIVSNGPGRPYLIQHSAGSGKTNTIAWIAPLLAGIVQPDGSKTFDTVLVVSDRTVIDNQLKGALQQFSTVKGLVAYIDGGSSSKSKELALAMERNAQIIVCTIQTFPFALEEIRRSSKDDDKHFAVICDEAHSSQGSETAMALRLALAASTTCAAASAAPSLDTADDPSAEEDISLEDVLLAQMKGKSDEDGRITYIALTATPKPKTIELFGTRPNASLPASALNVPAPFHVYSMRQAIEEDFILDPLLNYTSYQVAHRIALQGATTTKKVNSAKTTQAILKWVGIQPHTIAARARIIVAHYLAYIYPLLNNHARAMAVAQNRLEAVLLHQAIVIEFAIQAPNLNLHSLVAFSGSIETPDNPGVFLTEESKTLNPIFFNSKGNITDCWNMGEHHILVVANKFQTGFNDPLLCGLYIDRSLSGLQAVQTISRINRSYPGKTTAVLDFKNDPADILKSFRQYYSTAELTSTSNPQQIYTRRQQLDDTRYYTDTEVNSVAKACLENTSQALLMRALSPVVSRLKNQYADFVAMHAAATTKTAKQAAADQMTQLQDFRADIGKFIRDYEFFCQIFNYGNTDIEKRYLFYKYLYPQLKFGGKVKNTDKLDTHLLNLTHYAAKALQSRSLGLSIRTPIPKLPVAIGSATHSAGESEEVLLTRVVARVNALFTGNLTEADSLNYYNSIRTKLLQSAQLAEEAKSNTSEQFAASPSLAAQLNDSIVEVSEIFTEAAHQLLGSESKRDQLADIILKEGGLYEELSSRAI